MDRAFTGSKASELASSQELAALLDELEGEKSSAQVGMRWTDEMPSNGGAGYLLGKVQGPKSWFLPVL